MTGPGLRRVGSVLAAALVLVVAVGVATRVVRGMVRTEVEGRVDAVASPALEESRRDEAARLDRAAWVDRDAGVVRVPLPRARELVIREWAGRPTGWVPIPPDAPSAPRGDGGVGRRGVGP